MHLVALLLFLMYPTLISVEHSRHEWLSTYPTILILVASNTYMLSIHKFFNKVKL